MTVLTQLEKLVLRLRTLQPRRLYTLRIVTQGDGQPGAWAVRDDGKVEGIPGTAGGVLFPEPEGDTMPPSKP